IERGLPIGCLRDLEPGPLEDPHEQAADRLLVVDDEHAFVGGARRRKRGEVLDRHGCPAVGGSRGAAVAGGVAGPDTSSRAGTTGRCTVNVEPAPARLVTDTCPPAPVTIP